MLRLLAVTVIFGVCATAPTTGGYNYGYEVVQGRQSFPNLGGGSSTSVSVQSPPRFPFPIRRPQQGSASDNGVQVSLIDRNALIDRLIQRLESMRIRPGPSSAQSVIPAAVESVAPAVSASTASEDSPDRPLVAIANFIEGVFNRRPGFQGTSESAAADDAENADGTPTERPSRFSNFVENVNEAVANVIAPLRPSDDVPVPLRSDNEPVKQEEDAPVVEAVQYGDGTIFTRSDGTVVYKPATTREIFVGEVAPLRPTIRNSFLRLVNPSEVQVPAVPSIVGPAYEPFYFFRRY